MKSKYLNEIGCEQTFSREKLDEEWEKIFEKEREEYGLASYDTWNLDITFFEFIYISFKMYNECNCVDTHFHKIIIDDEEWDMQKVINYIIEISKKYLIQRNENFFEYDEIPEKFYTVLKIALPYMWW